MKLLEIVAILLATGIIGGSLGAVFGWSVSKVLRLSVLLCAMLPLPTSALTGRVVEIRTAPCATVSGYGSISVSSTQPTRWRLRTSSGWTGWLSTSTARRTMPVGTYLVEFARSNSTAPLPMFIRVESKTSTLLLLNW